MNVLDYLLPKSFMSDVQTTFRPKSYDLTRDEFMPEWGESEEYFYDVFQSLRDQGYEPTEQFVNKLMADSPGSQFLRRRVKDDETGKYKWETYENPDWAREANYIQNILSSGGEAGVESGMFYDKNAPAPNIFGGQSLAEGFERAGVYEFDSAMAKPLRLSILRGIDPGSYTKEIDMKRGTLAEALTRQKAKISQIGGGFAGYGQRGAAQNVAEQQFQTGAEGIYEDVNKKRAGFLDQLYSGLEGYGSTIDKIVV